MGGKKGLGIQQRSVQQSGRFEESRWAYEVCGWAGDVGGTDLAPAGSSRGQRKCWNLGGRRNSGHLLGPDATVGNSLDYFNSLTHVSQSWKLVSGTHFVDV